MGQSDSKPSQPSPPPALTPGEIRAIDVTGSQHMKIPGVHIVPQQNRNPGVVVIKTEPKLGASRPMLEDDI